MQSVAGCRPRELRVHGAVEKVPAVAVLVEPSRRVAGDLKGVTGQDAAHLVVTMCPPSSAGRGQPGLVGDAQHFGHHGARGDEGGGR